MNTHCSIFLILFSLCFGTGCSSLVRNADYSVSPKFSEMEIRSRTWNNAEGQRLKLRSWSLIRLKHKDDLIIAKYGEENLNIDTSADVYRVVHQLHKPDAFVPVWHDFESTRLADIKIDDNPDETLIRIIRETIPGTLNPGQHHEYVFHYRHDYTLCPDPEEWWWQIPEKK
jgi:hypothetical protein